MEVVWATVVAVCGASAEPKPSSVGTAKTEAKAASAAGEFILRPGRLSTEAETRTTNLPEGVERSSILIRGPCVRKSQSSAEGKGSPPKVALSVRGTSPPKAALPVWGTSPPKAALSEWDTSPPKPTPGIGEKGVCSPQDLMRWRPPSLTGVRLVDPLRLYFVAGSGKRYVCRF